MSLNLRTGGKWYQLQQNSIFLEDESKSSTTNLTLNERYFDELLMQNGKVRRLQHADGFINLSQNGTPVEYFYYVKDHLGNVRATLTNSSLNGLTVMQANDYYPFGMSYTPRQTGLQDSNWENKYKYNGKEEQEVPGGWLDFHARFYDPAIVRTTTQDPHAENYYSESSYSFMGNNPIINIDPTGMDWFYYKKKHGNDATYHWHDGSTHALSFTYIDSDGNEQNENIELQGTKSAILFEGSEDESLSTDGELTGEGANAATVTVFGPRGKDDVQQYNGLTVSSDPSKYSMLQEGQYEANYSPMATSIYGDNERTKERGIPGALTYSLSQDGSTNLPVVGGVNKATGKTYMSGAFIHRTDWSGSAKYASKGCLVIDGRQYRRFEKQLGKSMSISVTLRRKK